MVGLLFPVPGILSVSREKVLGLDGLRLPSPSDAILLAVAVYPTDTDKRSNKISARCGARALAAAGPTNDLRTRRAGGAQFTQCTPFITWAIAYNVTLAAHTTRAPGCVGLLWLRIPSHDVSAGVPPSTPGAAGPFCPRCELTCIISWCWAGSFRELYSVTQSVALDGTQHEVPSQVVLWCAPRGPRAAEGVCVLTRPLTPTRSSRR